MSAPVLTLACAASELDDLWPAAICLSLVTGRAFRLESPPDAPPLVPRAWHLALARAACELGDAPVGEALAFPADGKGRAARARELHLDVGALGTCSALGWLIPPLSLAGGGALHLRGATHPAAGASVETASLWWPTVLGAFGRRLSVRLQRASFAPQLGGALVAEVPPEDSSPPALVELQRRGTLHEVRITSVVAGAQAVRADRQRQGALTLLRERGIQAEAAARALPSDAALGGAVWIQAQFEHSTAVFSAVAAPGEAPEATGARAAAQLVAFLASPGATDPDTAAQLLLWGALLADGRLGRSEPGTTEVQAPRADPALRAIARAAEAFLQVTATVDEDGRCRVAPRPR